jgi:hypothetical protein
MGRSSQPTGQVTNPCESMIFLSALRITSGSGARATGKGGSAAKRYMYFPRFSPEALHSSTRTRAGLLRSTRRELLLDAGTFFLLTSDFFSMTLSQCGTRLTSPPSLTKCNRPAKKATCRRSFASTCRRNFAQGWLESGRWVASYAEWILGLTRSIRLLMLLILCRQSHGGCRVQHHRGKFAQDLFQLRVAALQFPSLGFAAR